MVVVLVNSLQVIHLGVAGGKWRLLIKSFEWKSLLKVRSAVRGNILTMIAPICA